MRWMVAGLAAAAMTLAACGERSAGGTTTKAAASTAASRPDPRLPDGFPIYLGATGARALEVMKTRQGGTIATFSVQATAAEVVGFYEDVSKRQGMAYAGRYDTDSNRSYEARRQGEGRPRTFGAVAIDKGEWTNVTLNFDVTP